MVVSSKLMQLVLHEINSMHRIVRKWYPKLHTALKWKACRCLKWPRLVHAGALFSSLTDEQRPRDSRSMTPLCFFVDMTKLKCSSVCCYAPRELVKDFLTGIVGHRVLYSRWTFANISFLGLLNNFKIKAMQASSF